MLKRYQVRVSGVPKTLCGQRIQRYRLKKKYSLRVIIDLLELNCVLMTKEELTAIEAGTRPVYVDELLAFSRILEVPMDVLAGLADR